MSDSRPATARGLQLFKTWFWRPPRPHGDTIVDRRVNPLELLYDLVYAAVIAQAGHHLADHVSLGGLVEYAVVFSLTCVTWTNVGVAMAVGAAAGVIVGWARPAPWLLAPLLLVVLSLVWAVAVRGFVLVGTWGTDEPS